ncbi:hypothetical protein HYFRA_00004183 [Hymenoscyphus fraxineus]|uniref:Uncharacterized protein n=1 Tax=Hymenoscyphus fraxineus TaxID=746836 RepID=A0A9N9KMN3_9HELO|nr:hypothetical protein HYFRA_00004183 [Hymenoscyphus fraxineus]
MDSEASPYVSKSQALEMAYQEAFHKADLIVKDEGARRLRLDILLLRHENEDLQEELALESDRIDLLETEGDSLRAQVEAAEEEARRYESELRVQTREVNNLRVEVASMNGVTMDSTKVLTEKLSLARELATLKPELEHLRSQATYHQTILSEKLALQRQVSSLEVELETEKRAAKRAAQKNDNTEREAEFQQQLDQLQKDLARNKREATRLRDEMENEYRSQLEEAQKELAREKRESAKATKTHAKELKALENQKDLAKEKLEAAGNRDEIEADLRSQLEEAQKELAREKREAAKITKAHEKELKALQVQKEQAQNKADSATSREEVETEFRDQLEEIQKDLAREKRESAKTSKEHEKELKALETRHAVLESKHEQIRTKLRATKEQLKEAQEEANHLRAAAVKATKSSSNMDAPAKKGRKRGAMEMTADDAIGTPDGIAARAKRPMKKARADQVMMAEKSMFSITPFLNRTANINPETPVEKPESEAEEEEVEEEEEQAEVSEEEEEQVASVPSPKAVSKAKGKKKAADKAAESATEEPAQKKPARRTKATLNEATSNPRKSKAAAKKSKPLSTLENVIEEEADENEEEDQAPEPEVTKKVVAKKTALKTKPSAVEEAGAKIKKRKLVGGTLFDEEDAEVTKRPPKVTLGAPRLMAKGGLMGPGGKMRGGLGAGSGFGTFSPLKKDKRGVGASFLA